ncbi:NAD-dependent succinate-semialdehyde dehydrogenase [Pseudogracilibacillus sp. SO10305]|uniref:NAD-dependent succinate-semialdehyde dehydrogenase n=1 Tax=Pseudogracilibacillus sp. SO10305 TaxID=3098292 RepID=UPI00300E4FB8
MLYINGEWLETEGTLIVSNPATGEKIDEVFTSGTEEAQLAIDSAEEAMEHWAKKTAKERSQYLIRTSEIIKSRIDEIAEVITKEMGKPLYEAKGEILLATDYLEWYAEEGKRIYGETIPASASDKRLMVIRQPVGVVGAITPWNFPIAMITRKIAPALAAGCTVVLKPASATPLTAIEVFKAFHEAGLPKGVVNLLHGSASKVVGVLMDSPVVRKITFTGSTEVGKHLMKQSADTMKKISMELGGHAPFIVFEDADLEQAAEAAIASKFRNAGQTCVCTNRIYVQKSVVNDFSDILKDKMSKLTIGNGLNEGVTIGPLIDQEAVDKAETHVKDAQEKGGKVLIGGERLDNDDFNNGSFFEPTLIVNANHSMKISFEETFGPVVPVFAFDTEEEVIQKANNTVYGLASYIFSNDINRVYRVMENLDYGIIGVNDPLPTVAQAPFGGVKESGVGREGGRHGIEDYLDYKYISMQLKI